MAFRLTEPQPTLRTRQAVIGAGKVLLGAVLGRGTTLLGTLLLAHLLVPERYGQLALIQTGAFAAGSIAALGLNLATTKSLADLRGRDPGFAGRLLGTAVSCTAIAGAVASLLLLVLGAQIATHVLRSSMLVVPLMLASPLPFLISLQVVQVAAFYGLGDFGTVLLSTTGRGLVVNVGMLGGAVLYGLSGGIAGIVAGELLTTATNFVLIARSTRRAGIAFPRRPAMGDLRRLGGVAVPSLLSTVLIQGSLWGSQVLLLYTTGGYVQAAYFGVAYRWHTALLFIPAALAPVALPVLSHLHASRESRDYLNVLRLTVLANLMVVVLPAAVVIVLSEPIMALAGGAYAVAWPVMAWLALAAVPTAANNVISQTALSLNLVRAWLASDVVLAVVLAALSLVLIPTLGAVGLAVAVAAAMTATCLVLIRPVTAGIRRIQVAG
jgi:O-antigen/teichoic acid export membrane protein